MSWLHEVQTSIRLFWIAICSESWEFKNSAWLTDSTTVVELKVTPIYIRGRLFKTLLSDCSRAASHPLLRLSVETDYQFNSIGEVMRVNAYNKKEEWIWLGLKDTCLSAKISL
jgi:hypothetical protein